MMNDSFVILLVNKFTHVYIISNLNKMHFITHSYRCIVIVIIIYLFKSSFIYVDFLNTYFI